MKTLARFVGVGALGLLAAGALAAGGSQSLVSPSQPHAIISTAMPPAPSQFRARIVWLDGKYLSTTRGRESFWVSPGKHEIGFQAILTSNRGPSLIHSPATSGPSPLKKLTLDLKRGVTYFFVAEVPAGGNPSKWRPVLYLKRPSDR